MSRIRKAAITAAFSYAHFGVAIVSGLVLVPLTLHYVGARSWGIWLATGELLGYAGMTDLGVLGVLPWMVAEADGRGDRAAIRRFVGHGVWIGGAVALVYAGVAAALWALLPSVLRLGDADRSMVAAPLALLVGIQTIGHPLRVFRAVVGGLQDAFFNGVLSILQAVLTMTISIGLMLNGYGLYALAAGAGIPPLIVFVLSLARLRAIAPDIMTGWTRPTLADARLLLVNGSGVWLAAIGGHLLSASNAIVITVLGRPEWVPIYSCTAKLSVLTTQLTWVPPDSALVALAQVHGERQGPARLRQIVVMMLRLHLLLGGAALCGLLVFNPAFVTSWVGSEFFGGGVLNVLLAIGVVVFSFVHGLTTIASVVGNRLRVGAASLLNGLAQVALALWLGRWWGLEGIAAAGLAAAFATSIPIGIALLRPVTSLSAGALLRDPLAPWAARAGVLVALSGVAGAFHRSLGLVLGASIAAAITAAYVWHMRPMYAGLPLNERWIGWLVRIKLMPAAAVGQPAPVLDRV